MAAVLTNDIQLSARVGDTTSTQRDHLRLIKPDDPRLIPYEMGPWERYIFAVFRKLDGDRSHGFSGAPAQITMRMLLDYQALYDDKLNTDELDVLEALDDAFLKTHSELKQDGG